MLKKLFLDTLDLSISTDLLDDLEALSGNYNADVTPVVASILAGTVASLSGSNFTNATSSTPDANLSPKEFGVIFLRVAAAGLVDGEVVVGSMSTLLVSYLTWEGNQKLQGKTKESTVTSEYRCAVEDIVRACSQRHPAEFDAVVQSVTEGVAHSGADTQHLSALLQRV